MALAMGLPVAIALTRPLPRGFCMRRGWWLEPVFLSFDGWVLLWVLISPPPSDSSPTGWALSAPLSLLSNFLPVDSKPSFHYPRPMFQIIRLILRSLFASFKTKRELALENLALRHQLAVAHRTMKAHHKRPKLSDSDRKLWIFLSNHWEKWRSPLLLFKPDTVVSWHRKLFRGYWRRLSMRNSQGRPTIHPKNIALIKNISLANPTWGAPRIHGELLKLFF